MVVRCMDLGNSECKKMFSPSLFMGIRRRKPGMSHEMLLILTVSQAKYICSGVNNYTL